MILFSFVKADIIHLNSLPEGSSFEEQNTLVLNTFLEVLDYLRSGWRTTGPKAKKFRKQFAEFTEEGFDTIAVNFIAAGLHLVLEALGIGHGSKVITTPYSLLLPLRR